MGLKCKLLSPHAYTGPSYVGLASKVIWMFHFRSYGLVVVPRVRFLARAAAKGNLNKGSTAPKGQKEKSANELLEMVLASAKNANANVSC